MKRFIDIILSLLAIIIISPIFMPIVIILLLTGEHYIFYSHDRVGFQGKTFKLIKFSTMLKNSPNLGTKDITVRNDPRVFPFGRFLRKTKINELPQILNVLKGDMSIVGPRPLTPRNFNFYSKEIKTNISKLKPGITGIGSIVFRDEEALLSAYKTSAENYYKLNISPYKGALESWYLYHQSTWLDFKLIGLTALIIFCPSIDINVFLKNLPRRPDLIEA
jgi:lipopolysaccharide/colanic/teichoic acid biosynthesis glycosyltransferase